MFFFLILILDIIEKSIGCYLVYPFLGVFLLKVQKECVHAIMLKAALVLVKNVFFGLKKGISELLHWIAAKPTADNDYVIILFSKKIIIIIRQSLRKKIRIVEEERDGTDTDDVSN